MSKRIRRYEHKIKCDQCGIFFNAATPKAKFCTDACRLAASRDRRKVSEFLKSIEYIASNQLRPAMKKYPVLSDRDAGRLRMSIAILESIEQENNKRPIAPRSDPRNDKERSPLGISKHAALF